MWAAVMVAAAIEFPSGIRPVAEGQQALDFSVGSGPD